MSSEPGPLWGQIVLLVVLIAVNAYFAAAEMAIVSVNKNRIRTLAHEGNKKAITLTKLMEDVREAIKEDRLLEFRDEFYKTTNYVSKKDK
jgi:CBS domain containing-hemolysin-like protein